MRPRSETLYDQLKGAGFESTLVGISEVIPGPTVFMGPSKTTKSETLSLFGMQVRISERVPPNMVIVTSRNITDMLIESAKRTVGAALKDSEMVIIFDEAVTIDDAPTPLPFDEEPLRVDPGPCKPEPKRFGKKHRDPSVFTGRGR